MVSESEQLLGGCVFVSYVQEDSASVDRLQRELEGAGLQVWRDTTDLWPGQDWRSIIRRAITENSLVFLACFSSSGVNPVPDNHNEEIDLAIGELRRRSPDGEWFIPVRLDECEIPAWDIGGGRTLRSHMQADLFGDNYEAELGRLTTSVFRVLGRSGTGARGRRGWRWDVALSFAGAQRTYVEQVAKALGALGVRCFYDADEEVYLWGKHLAEELPTIYGEQAATVVLFASAEYAARDWTRHERRAALGRAVRERREYVLLARFDDTPLPGLLPDVVWVDLRARPPQQFAEMIAAKLGDLGVMSVPPARSAEDGIADAGHMRYLDGLTGAARSRLAALNRPGLIAMDEFLRSGRGVAFLGDRTSTPLYPLWQGLITELIDAARDKLSDQTADTCLAMAARDPDAVVELVRGHIGQPSFREMLRYVFRARRDTATGKTWTPIQELIARCRFAGIITTNYDPGIVNARMAVRPLASGTGFASWTDEDALDLWRAGDVFGEDKLPVLFAHGHHNQPDAMVLATTDYQRAYAGKLSAVVRTVVESGHLIWIGFSFDDPRVRAILRQTGEPADTVLRTDGTPRHVAVLPWDPGTEGDSAASPDPLIIREAMETEYGCHAILYPAPNGDHSALSALLAAFARPEFAHAGNDSAALRTKPRPEHVPALPAGHDRIRSTFSAPVVRWEHGGVPVDHFTGRKEELARLDRWAADPEVRLIGVTAWGGAGKTTLVTEWLRKHDLRRPVRGIFGWSFYDDPSAELWANELLAWAEQAFGYGLGKARRLTLRVLELMRHVPLLLVLDGLEQNQEAPRQQDFGRFLDDLLRSVLTGLCQRNHTGLVVLTSRFPFADLEPFDGAAARMLDVPAFTAAEGAELLSSVGGEWVPESERRRLVSAVDGHALAVGVLARSLADRPPASDMAELRQELESAERTDARVGRVLQFYAARLSVPGRMLLAIVSLFSRPVPIATILALGESEALGRPLSGWTVAQAETEARGPLAGLLTWHPDGSVSAHPLVMDTFRPLVLTGDSARLAMDVALADLPARPVISHDAALRVVEMIELLLDADQWQAADNLHYTFMDRGKIWARIPAARLGQRCTSAFVGTGDRRDACKRQLSAEHLARYVNYAGLCAMLSGDMTTAESFLNAALDHHSDADYYRQNRALAFQRLSQCMYYQGHVASAKDTAARAVELARDCEDTLLRNAMTTLGAALDLAGDATEADRCFTEADMVQVRHGSASHIYSLGGTLWADLLLRTGRIAVARLLTEANREICELNRWNHGIARCDRLLARCDLADGDFRNAETRLVRAARTFRDGDFLIELAMTLPDLAELRRLADDLTAGERLCGETINLAGPRQLVPSHARALAVRARIRADEFADRGDALLCERARDDAAHAIRLSTRIRHLPWEELGALNAHAHIDAVTGQDKGWHKQAADLKARLSPKDLPSDPLAAPGQIDRQEELPARARPTLPTVSRRLRIRDRERGGDSFLGTPTGGPT